MGQILLSQINRKSPIGFRLVYFHLTLSNSKGQGHSQFDREKKSIKLSHAAFRRISASTLPFLANFNKDVVNLLARLALNKRGFLLHLITPFVIQGLCLLSRILNLNTVTSIIKRRKSFNKALYAVPGTSTVLKFSNEFDLSRSYRIGLLYECRPYLEVISTSPD